MATEFHECVRREGCKKKRNTEMDLELNEIRERMEQLALMMQQEAKLHWRYECPLNRMVKWLVQKLLARKQQQELRRWLSELENLTDIGEEQIHICEPEIGRHLSDEEEVRSNEDLINSQVGRNGISSCQVRNRKRSMEGIIYYQGRSDESSYFQVGNEMGSVDLIKFLVGRREVPNCQVGRRKEMRLSESIRSLEVGSC
jgi:regulator of replication initiation timing